MKILLLNISDIHVGSVDKPENEGLVLKSFIQDVEEQIKKFSYDDIFVLVSGDLVFAASDSNYNKFDTSIVKKLLKLLNIGETISSSPRGIMMFLKILSRKSKILSCLLLKPSMMRVNSMTS